MDGKLLRFRKDVKYAFFDAETFNLSLSFRQNRLWQSGLLFVEGEDIKERHDIRIKSRWEDAPYLSIGAGAAAITRFNENYHAKLAIDQKEAFYKTWGVLKRADYIIGHNFLNFDIYLLRGWAELNRESWKWITPKVIDTKALAFSIKTNNLFNPQKEEFFSWQYKMAVAYQKSIKTNLALLGKEYGIEHDYDNLHDAIVDLELNKKVWDKIKWQVEI